jgi:integrase
MASSWIVARPTRANGRNKGKPRYRVVYRLAGSGSPHRYGGSFATKAEALERKRWVDGELAGLRGNEIAARLKQRTEPLRPVTLREVAARWQASRIDVSDGTRKTYATNLDRVLPTLGDRLPASLTAADVASLAADLHDGGGLKRESIRKTLSTLAQVLDFAKVAPNPARDDDVRLPADDSEEVNPPTADHVTAAHNAIAPAYRLAVVVLDATGMRVGELEALRWGDVDERAGRWRVPKATTKTRKGRWVPVPKIVLHRVLGAVPREDRDLDGQMLAGFDADAFRTALARACKASGTPAFSPHDLRHRRATLWHLGGVPVAEAAGWLGHSPQEHLKTYAHVVLDRSEVDYRELPVLAQKTGRPAARRASHSPRLSSVPVRG